MNAASEVAKRPACILIVDDDDENREVLQIVLEWEGFSTVSAAGGLEALAAIAAHPPDLVLLDIMMPGMDGYQVAARLKGDPLTRDIPVMMVSALRDGDVRALCLSAGAADFLTKPMDRVEVVLRIKEVLRLQLVEVPRRVH